MKKALFFSVLTLFLAISCQKEALITQTIAETTVPLTLQSVNDIIDQIDFETLQIKHETLQFTGTEHFNNTLNLLEQANKKYDEYTSQKAKLSLDAPVEYDNFYVNKQFVAQLDGFSSLQMATNVRGSFFNTLPKFIKSTLNQNSEMFIGDTYYIYFKNGESLEINAPAIDEIIMAREEGVSFAGTHRGNCQFSNATNAARIFDYCGGEFVYHNSVSYFNVGDFHRIDAASRCYKRGGLGDFIDFGNLTAKVKGLISIDCDITLNVQDASAFNANLINGQVPYYDTCMDCGNAVVMVAYTEPITMHKEIHFIEGLFYMTLDLEGCNEVLFEDMNLRLELE